MKAQAGKRSEADHVSHQLRKESQFRVGDWVYLSMPGERGMRGPYLVASVPQSGRYTLSLEDGEPVESGTEVDEQNLTSVS